MQALNTLSPLPFYDSLSGQDRYRHYSEGYKHFAPSDVLIPFYVTIPKEFAEHFWDTVTIRFYDCCGNEITGAQGGSFSFSFSNSFEVTSSSLTSSVNNYASRMAMNGVKIVKGDEYDTLIYYALHSQSIGLPKGEYYLRLTFSMTEVEGNTYDAYSDLFVVDSGIKDMVELSWGNEENILYKNGYAPFGVRFGSSSRWVCRVYLDTKVGMPEYGFTEEGEERSGYFYPTKQISEKVHKMRFVAPEYLCDAMRVVRLSDYVTLTQYTVSDERDAVGGQLISQDVYEIGQFDMEVEWLEQGYYADVQCSFKTDTIVKKIGRAYNFS